MQYLCGNSKSEISFAVNQVVRHGNNPRRVHEQAVKRIGRYLLHTLYKDKDGIERTRGTIFKLSPEELKQPLRLDLWADADFAGTWNAEEQHDPDTARS